ncbi:N-acetylmuramoyl-L-alanine amidase [Candidatus Falkowbacteria bacterium]|nr:MAG: N-acetylmuramoyl-L-alanine amidase [Candidatus Falkowbacteria bacterium]
MNNYASASKKIFNITSLALIIFSVWLIPHISHAQLICCETHTIPDNGRSHKSKTTKEQCEGYINQTRGINILPENECEVTEEPKKEIISESLKSPALAVRIPGLIFRNNPCTEESCPNNWLADYIASVYEYSIIVIAILAVISLMLGGVIWLISAGNRERIDIAKKRILHGILGVMLVLASYLILNSINPNLISFKPIDLKYIKNKSLEMPEMTKEEEEVFDQMVEDQENSQNNSGSGNRDSGPGDPDENESYYSQTEFCNPTVQMKNGKKLIPKRYCTEFIVVHTTVSNATAAVTNAIHKSGDYDCIAYNRFVDRKGIIVDGRGEAYSGGHAQCYNDRSVGIVYSGCKDESWDTFQAFYPNIKYIKQDSLTFDKRRYIRPELAAYMTIDSFDTSVKTFKSPLEDDQIIIQPALISLIEEIRRLQRKYGIPTENVLGHFETARAKACPCLNMNDIRLVLTIMEHNVFLYTDIEAILVSLPQWRKIYNIQEHKGYLYNIHNHWPRLLAKQQCCYPKNDPPKEISAEKSCINREIKTDCWGGVNANKNKDGNYKEY